MMRRDGRGTGRPNSVASSTQAATASWTAARTASAVSPSDMQPGKSGTSATNPPPSSSVSGSMMTGYSSFGIACFNHRVNEPNNLPDVTRLDWPTRWFVESLLTQTLIIHIIRTAKIPFLESRASSALITTTIVICVVGIALPFTAVGDALGFTPLPWLYWPLLIVMLLSYSTLAHLAKVWFVHRWGM
jgi:magnesium-transporting ATPase (P-type)